MAAVFWNGEIPLNKIQTFLLITGGLTALLFAVPKIVVAGYAFFLMPGIFLSYFPTVFTYSLLWHLIQVAIKKTIFSFGLNASSIVTKSVIGILAVILLVVPAFLIPIHFNGSPKENIHELLKNDTPLASEISLPPIVAVVVPKRYSREKRSNQCESICLRLLYNKVVAEVIVAKPPSNGSSDLFSLKGASYIIEKRDQCPKPSLVSSNIVWPRTGLDRLDKRIEDRIASGDCLIRRNGVVKDADLVIAYLEAKKEKSKFSHPWQLALDTVSANRLEIKNRAGMVLFRRTEVESHLLAVPLHINVLAGMLTTVTYFGWARTKFTINKIGPHGRDVLPDILGEAAKLPDATSPQ